jgi:hypothetical protein
MEQPFPALVPAHKQGAAKNASGRSGGCRHRVVGLLTNALLANEAGCVVSPLPSVQSIVRPVIVPFAHSVSTVKNFHPVLSTTEVIITPWSPIEKVNDGLITPLEQALGFYVIKADVTVVKLCIAMRVIARSRALLYDQHILRLVVDASEVFVVRLAILARRGPLQLEVNADKPSSKLVRKKSVFTI